MFAKNLLNMFIATIYLICESYFGSYSEWQILKLLIHLQMCHSCRESTTLILASRKRYDHSIPLGSDMRQIFLDDFTWSQKKCTLHIFHHLYPCPNVTFTSESFFNCFTDIIWELIFQANVTLKKNRRAEYLAWKRPRNQSGRMGIKHECMKFGIWFIFLTFAGCSTHLDKLLCWGYLWLRHWSSSNIISWIFASKGK